MNFLQLTQRLAQEAGASGSGPTSCQGQTGEYGRMVNWISGAWTDIQNTREDWDWMRLPFAFPTVAGQPIYTPAQAGITSFGAWARGSFRNYSNPQVTVSIASPGVVNLPGHGLSVGDTLTFFTTGSLPTGLTAGVQYYVNAVVDSDNVTLSATAGGASINTSGSQSGIQTVTSSNTTTFSGFSSEIFMDDDMSYEAWRDSYEYGALRTIKTRPVAIAVTPLKSLALGPFPDVGYTVAGEYYSLPVTLSADTDTPALPVQYHMAIVYRALMFYGEFESAPDAFGRGQREYATLLRRIGASRLRHPRFAGALA